jgi:hypothetical protein
MEFARSPLMRGVALLASLALVLVHWSDRGTWFWIGLVLLVTNVLGLFRARSQADRPRPSADAGMQPQRQSHRLVDLLHVSGVSTAIAAGPERWRQVSYLDDEPMEPVRPEELAEHIWLERFDAWEIGLGDEVKPYLDLDIDEESDPIVRVLADHPAVADAYHEDREVYRVEERRPIGVEEFAALAARALVSHHIHVAERS